VVESRVAERILQGIHAVELVANELLCRPGLNREGIASLLIRALPFTTAEPVGGAAVRQGSA
jgi:hypothetical protein